MNASIAVVVPNWNGKDVLPACLESLRRQTCTPAIIVVENGSRDGSLELLREKYSDVQLVVNKTNRGFAGGVNDGIRAALKQGCDYVALFNNDAVAEPDWLEKMASVLEVELEFGIATCKFIAADKTYLDSTGELYTVWGLSYPRGRGEPVSDAYDTHTSVFAASGGASLYRAKMFDEIGLFDEDFFAYYEDVDISFRAQLSAWQVRYVPEAVAYHHIGATSSKVRGFTTYQTMKNLPLVLFKNVPRKFLWRVAWRLAVAETLFWGRAIARGNGWSATKGLLKAKYLLLKNIPVRRRIQNNRKVSDEYIWRLMTHDLPPNARHLRQIRSAWHALARK